MINCLEFIKKSSELHGSRIPIAYVILEDLLEMFNYLTKVYMNLNIINLVHLSIRGYEYSLLFIQRIAETTLQDVDCMYGTHCL